MNTNLEKNNALFEYLLRLGDTSLILGHRIAEWCGHAPILEEDIALTNISLDHIGQARLLLDYAGKIEGKGRNEDTLAYHRDARQFRNLLMAEQPNGDFGNTMVRQFLVSVYNFHLYSALSKSADAELAAIAAKSVKEVAYHVRHSSDWLIRLGDGTTESHERVQQSINDLWIYVDDFFNGDEVDALLVGQNIAPDLNAIRALWNETVQLTMVKAGLVIPQVNSAMRTGSRKGNHTEYLGYILAEMQFLPRAYPDAEWL
ncbi:MAG: phenylacetate-CoA oxygenase subunit PaaC [Bacteroidetes bacterium]|nr:phenylacetate-CoA oxygenase subunit PaaC [Bacteroidota bacterium]